MKVTDKVMATVLRPRVTAVINLLAWLIVFSSRLFVHKSGIQPPDLLTLKTYGIIAGTTLFVSVILLIVPRRVYLYALLYYVWGLLRLVDGVSMFGMFLCCAGYIIFFRQGFFQSFTKTKNTVFLLSVFASFIAQIRYGLLLFEDSVLAAFEFSALACMLRIVLDKDIMHIINAFNEKNLELSAASFTLRDCKILQRILNGKKYSAIAREEGMPPRTFSRHVNMLYKRLGVGDKTLFLARYARRTVIRIGEDAPEPEQNTGQVSLLPALG